MVYVVFMLFGVMVTLIIGSVGYFIHYKHEEKKKQKQNKTHYNPMSGWMLYS